MLTLEIKKKLADRSSERLLSVDQHPQEPWILAILYPGTVCIWNYQTQTMVKSFEVSESTVTSAKFVPRKQWVVAAVANFIHIYSYNNSKVEKVIIIPAHVDSISCVAVHPSLPYVLSSSDDKFIKLWDWDEEWACTKIFKGHSFPVTQVALNPKDTITFASSDLSGNIRIWNLELSDSRILDDGNDIGATCIDFFTDKPYLITGHSDNTAKVWDYQLKTCLRILEGHMFPVSTVCFHPELQIILTGSVDGVRIWDATTFRRKDHMDFKLGHVCAILYVRGGKLLIGHTYGICMPVFNMDVDNKVTWTTNCEVIGGVRVGEKERLEVSEDLGREEESVGGVRVEEESVGGVRVEEESVDVSEDLRREEESVGGVRVGEEDSVEDSENLRREEVEFPINSCVLVFYEHRLYPARILYSNVFENTRRYYVTYHGFSPEWDEWINRKRIVPRTEKFQKISDQHQKYDGSETIKDPDPNRVRDHNGRYMDEALVRKQHLENRNIHLPRILFNRLIDDMDICMHIGEIAKLSQIQVNVVEIIEKFRAYTNRALTAELKAFLLLIPKRFNQKLSKVLFEAEMEVFQEYKKQRKANGFKTRASLTYGGNHLIRLCGYLTLPVYGHEILQELLQYMAMPENVHFFLPEYIRYETYE